MSTRNYISKDKIEKIGIRKYQENGLGITFQDIEREFSVNKGKAQRTLKHFHRRDVLFTANDLRLEGIISLPNKRPQQYFATCIKAEIIEGLSKRKNVLVKPTGVTHSSRPLSSVIPHTLNSTDQIVLQTLEGFILPLLPTTPSYIHNIHLKLSIVPQCYLELSLPTISGYRRVHI
ncbi:MAG: hypothetical protein WA667_00190 [Candidatus Nitrosopolaris sp.]